MDDDRKKNDDSGLIDVQSADLPGITWRFWFVSIVIFVAVMCGFWLIGDKRVAQRQAETKVRKTIAITVSDAGRPVIKIDDDQVDSSLDFLNWPKNGAATVRFVEDDGEKKEDVRAFVCQPEEVPFGKEE